MVSLKHNSIEVAIEYADRHEAESHYFHWVNRGCEASLIGKVLTIVSERNQRRFRRIDRWLRGRKNVICRHDYIVRRG